MDEDALFGAINTIWFAEVTALAGDVGRAIPALEELLTKQSPMTRDWLRVDSTYDRVRGYPQFTALLAKTTGVRRAYQKAPVER